MEAEELAMQVAQEEYKHSTRALQANTPEHARRTSQRRMDATLAGQSRAGLACRDGCHFCCYLRVVVTAPEVFGFIDYLESTLTSVEFAQFKSRVLDAALRVEPMSQQEHILTNVACPALSQGLCLGYAARPMMCRNYHATDVQVCKDAYDDPLNDKPRSDALLGREAAGAAHLQAWRSALQHSGFDSRQYEFIKALREALTSDEPARRFNERKGAFAFPPDETFLAD